MTDVSTASPAPPATPRRLYALVGAVVLLACVLVSAGHLQSPDGELLFRQTESLALRGSLTVVPLEYDTPEGRALVPADQTFATVLGRAGGFHVQYLPLQSLLAMPLVWLARATQAMFAEVFASTLVPSPTHYLGPDANGTWRRAVVVALFNPLVTALTALVLMRLALFLTHGNRRAGAATALFYAFTTMALPHSRTFFTEPLAGLFALVALDQVLRWYKTPLAPAFATRRLRQMIAMGAAMAAAIWTRMDSPLIAAGMGLSLVAAGEWKRREEQAYARSTGQFPLRDYAVAGGIIVLAYIALLGFNAWRFSGGASVLGGGYSGQAEGVKLSTPVLIGLQGYLMSPGKSILLFSPGIVLGIWGWMRRPRHLGWAAAIAAGSYLLFAILQAKWQNWDGGWCWGPRHIYQLHAPIMLGAGFLFVGAETLVRRVVVKVLAIVGLFAALFGCLQSPIDFYHEYFRTPEDGEYFRVEYRGMELATVRELFHIQPRFPEMAVDPAASPLPAPMYDSLYVPQHTQWAGYPRMLKRGMCDWWLLVRLFPAEIFAAPPPGE